jgi:hypothetical protein
MYRPLVGLCAFGVAFGLPAYYVWIKHRAASSLRGLLKERFSPQPCSMPEIPTPRGPVIFSEAYLDKRSGLVLVLGFWRRSRKDYNLVAGLFKPAGKLYNRGIEHDGQHLLLRTNVEGGDLIVWKELPSRESVLGYLHSVL